MEFIVQLTVDLPEDVVEFLGVETIAAGLETKFENALNVALPSYASRFRVEVGTEDGPDNDADEIESAPADRDTPKGRTGLTDRQVASAYRAGIPVVKSGVNKGGPSGRTGRPATLHNLRAADGEPVRASGPRSREVLENQGIAVWDVDKGETGPAVKPKNTGERVAPQRAGKPVMKKRG